ncbi:MAG: hypothetical protein ACR2OB_06870 [Solirubrobacteraceae bacterium]
MSPTSREDNPGLPGLPRFPGDEGDAPVKSDGGSTSRTPRWSPTVGVIVVVVLVSVLVLLHLTGTIGAGGH